MKYYPAFWDIRNKRCVVVGGGDVALRKVKRLLDCGAQVSVVSPKLVPELISLKAENAIEHIAAEYDIRYMEEAALIIGATDDEKTNADIYEALTTARPYKEAMNKEDAVKTLKAYSGNKLDPKLVDVFIELVKTKENI